MKVEQHVMVEVAPAELAAKSGGPVSEAEPRLELARGDAAEVQVRRQPRGRPVHLIARRVVALLAICEEALEPLTSVVLTADGRLGHLLTQAEGIERGNCTSIDAGWERGQRRRCAEDRAPVLAFPRALECGEHRVRPPGLGVRRADVVDCV